ncbi:MAG: DUF3703 domain-containing protein [Burkholderiaceae bacterium]
MKNSFAHNIRPFVDAELQTATALSAQGQVQPAFTHLERAHVLGQAATAHHVRVHWRMFLWGLQQRNAKECLGQLLRIAGAATKTAFGLVPHGNTGGANVSPFKPMSLPPELEMRIKQARGVS